MRVDYACMLAPDTNSLKKSNDLGVNANQAIKTAKNKTSKRIWPSRFAFVGRRIPAGMKCHDRLRAARERAHESETEEPLGQHSSDMEVDDVIIQAQEKLNQSARTLGIIDFLCVGLSVPCDIDDRAGHSLPSEESADCHQVALDSAMWRRIRT